MSTSAPFLDPSLDAKLRRCKDILAGLGRVVIAFSGGVDSTLLVALAVEGLGRANVLAAIAAAASLPDREKRAAKRLAEQLGAELVEIETGEMSDPRYLANSFDRCFHCKKHLFESLRRLADERGFPEVLCGANADDRGDFRPGLMAGELLGIRNPLLEAGLAKDEIRTVSQAMGLETWDKPAMACLASRVPYGDPITSEKLKRIEQAENVLKDLGFAQCRVRDHGPIARIEVLHEALSQAIAMRATLLDALGRLGYAYITLDLQGFRSGAMNEVLDGQPARSADFAGGPGSLGPPQ